MFVLRARRFWGWWVAPSLKCPFQELRQRVPVIGPELHIDSRVESRCEKMVSYLFDSEFNGVKCGLEEAGFSVRKESIGRRQYETTAGSEQGCAIL